MLRVGLTGGIACGKSHVLRGLAAAGFGTLDLDSISHEVLASDRDAAQAVIEAFGVGVLAPEGGVDRKALGRVVFADASARGRLNGILHPRIRAIEEQRTRELSLASDVLVTDGALLIESGGHLRFDRLIVVHCPEDVQVERLRRRDGLDARAARRRLEAQMETREKRRFASFEVDTAGSHAETDGQTAELADALRRLASEQRPDVRPRAVQAAACLRALPEEGPWGLRLLEVLAGAARSRRLDLAEIAARMVPRPRGAWYEAAGERPQESGAEWLALIAALWCLGVRGYDPELAVAAGAAAARLVRRDGESLGGACLAAESVLTIVQEGRVPVSWREGRQVWRREAAKWGAGAAAAVAGALDAAAHNPMDAVAARTEAQGSSGSGALAGALVGLSVGLAGDEQVSAELSETCQALGFV